MGGCHHNPPLYLHFAHIHLLIVCIAHNWVPTLHNFFIIAYRQLKVRLLLLLCKRR